MAAKSVPIYRVTKIVKMTLNYVAACAAVFMLILGILSSAAQAAASGTLRIAVGSSPATFDPHFNDLPTGNTVAVLVFEGLFRLDAQNRVVPNLATDYAFSDDGLIFTVKIRADHVFSNGDPLNAQMVAASFMRLLNSDVGSIHRGLYAVIQAVIATDETTVTFRLKEPNGHILLLLAAPMASIIHADEQQQMGA